MVPDRADQVLAAMTAEVERLRPTINATIRSCAVILEVRMGKNGTHARPAKWIGGGRSKTLREDDEGE